MAITAADFPAARIKRTGSSPASTGVVQNAPAVPQTRIFAWVIGANPGRRSTVTFGPLRAPWLVQTLQFSYTAAGIPPGIATELGVAPANVVENDVLNTDTRPYVPFVEPKGNALGGFNPKLQGWYHESAGSTGKVLQHTINKIVTQDGTFLAVANMCEGPGGNSDGTVTVLEGISQETAQAFP